MDCYYFDAKLDFDHNFSFFFLCYKNLSSLYFLPLILIILESKVVLFAKINVYSRDITIATLKIDLVLSNEHFILK